MLRSSVIDEDAEREEAAERARRQLVSTVKQLLAEVGLDKRGPRMTVPWQRRLGYLVEIAECEKGS